jgi:hypothetical protein
VTCIGASECYCGSLFGYNVPDGCQTSAPASVTTRFAPYANHDFNQGDIFGAVYYSGAAWVTLGGSNEELGGVAVMGGTMIPAPASAAFETGAAATATTGGSSVTSEPSSDSSSSTASSPASSSSATGTASKAAGPAAAAVGASFVGLFVAGIAAGAFLL